MKVELWYIGKTNERYLQTGEAIYEKRLKHYLPISVEVLPDIKNAGKLTALQLKAKEADMILSKLQKADGLILLDEKGKHFTSMEMSQWLDKQLQRSYRRLIFLVGGAFGFDERVYDRCDGKLSLSKLTFSHQMVRLFLLEQIYRSMTILRGEKYHNE